MKQYLKLWSLLAAAFAIFLLYSWLDPDLTLAGAPLRPIGKPPSPLKGESLRERPQQQFPLQGAEGASQGAEGASQRAEGASSPSTAVPPSGGGGGSTILFIGDSMLEGLSPRLAAYCDASGHDLYTVIWYSSTTEQWGSSSRLSQYISDLRPSYVIICLGANELFVKDISSKRDKYVKTLLAQIGDIPYLWIGPPNWKSDTGINELIASNVPEGNFFVTNGMKFKRKKDGAHPTAESAIEWMDSVVRWMPLHSAHPILLNPPDKETSRPHRVFTHSPKN